MKKRGFRDRDFLETPEGFLFCVVGPYHPQDRVISYIKYVPSKNGIWKRKKQKFKRIMKMYTIPNLLETFHWLKDKYPQYVFHSQYYNIEMTAVPKNRIIKHYKPEIKLSSLFTATEPDSLQAKLIEFVEILSSSSGIPISSFGITGSILLDIHNPAFSDIDLTIYGIKNSFELKETMLELYDSDIGIKRFYGKTLEKWLFNKTKKHPLSINEARNILKRKWNLGLFKGTIFSIHPIKTENELSEKYGDKTYFPRGFTTVKAEISDDKDSLFLPAIYKICKVKILNGSKVSDIHEVVSYESLYDSLASTGEKIIAHGKLELVKNNKTNRTYHRILVGSPEGKGKEFIKPV